MLRLLNMKYNFFSTFTLVLERFFHGSGSGTEFFRIRSGFVTNLDFWMIQIRTQEKNLDLDPG